MTTAIVRYLLITFLVTRSISISAWRLYKNNHIAFQKTTLFKSVYQHAHERNQN